MFALADATLVRPLPFPEPERLVSLSELWQGQPGGAVNPVDFVDWTERTHTFAAIAAVVRGGGSIVGDDGVAEPIPAQAVTARFFDVLGVTPIAGRTFRDDDEGPAPDVVVLSEGFWRRRFGADPTLVGRATRFGGQTFTVIGIVPADFQFELPGTTSEGPSMMWTLLNPPQDRTPAQRYPHYLQVIGRLKPGVTLDAARADIGAVAAALAQEMPGSNKGHVATASPLRDRVVRSELRLTAILLLGVVGLVLLMCCANVANLLLARASARSREFAIRSALGAGRRRIVRQVLTESLVLAILGGLLGAAFGAAILRAAPSLIPAGLIPQTVTIGFDGRVVTFCAARRARGCRSLRSVAGVANSADAAGAGDDERRALCNGCQRPLSTGARRQSGCHCGVPLVWSGFAAALAAGARWCRLGLSRRRSAHPDGRRRRAWTGRQRPRIDVHGNTRPTSARLNRFPECVRLLGGARCRSGACGTGRLFRSTATRRGRQPIETWPAIRSSARRILVCSEFRSCTVVACLKVIRRIVPRSASWTRSSCVASCVAAQC